MMTRFPIKMYLSARGLNAREEKIQVAFYMEHSLTAALALLDPIMATDFVWRALQVIKMGNSVINVGLLPS